MFSIMKPIFVFLYLKLWKPWVYDKNGCFSKTNAGLYVVFLYVVFISFTTITWTLFHSFLYITTYEYEKVYLTNSQEINTDEDIHAIRGCESLTCSEENAIYFRVRPTVITHLYSIVNHGNIFYPDLTASVVAPGMNECEVASYGIRIKTLMRKWDIYPDMLSATCKPLNK